MDSWVTPPKRVTSSTWGPPPPCKQALTKHENCDLHIVTINLHVAVNFQLFQYCALKEKNVTVVYNLW